MRLKACHFHRHCHSPSPCPSHLATSLAPRHPTLPTLLLTPSVTPLSEHKLPHPVLHSPPHPVPAPLYARDAAGCYSQKPRRHAVNHAEQAHGQRPPQRRRVRRKEPRRGPVAASESIATHKKRATSTRHNARHYAPSVTLRQSKPLRTPRNCVCPARDSRTATPLVSPASRASTTPQRPACAAASEPALGRGGRACWEPLFLVGKQLQSFSTAGHPLWRSYSAYVAPDLHTWQTIADQTHPVKTDSDESYGFLSF